MTVLDPVFFVTLSQLCPVTTGNQLPLVPGNWLINISSSSSIDGGQAKICKEEEERQFLKLAPVKERRDASCDIALFARDC